jgi:hypothetical protein
MMKLRRAFLLGAFLVLISRAALAQPAPVPIGPGAIYQEIYRPEGPWAIRVVEADLSQQYLELHTLLGGGETLARRQLSGIVASEHMQTGRPIAAVNGDFFSLASNSGLMLGLHVEDDELVTFPDPGRSVFCVLSDGTMHIDRLRANAWLRGPDSLLLQFSGMNRPPSYADLILFTPRFGQQTQADPGTMQIALVGLTDRVHPNVELNARVASITTDGSQRIPSDGAVIAARGVSAYALRKMKVGDEVTLSLQMEPEKGEIEQAISGGPRIVRDGEVSVEYQQERFVESFASMRHPRTGLGIRDGTLVMVTVDGRQPGYSDGMTLYEFAKLFVELGCTDAMNLDGGGSTTMVVRDRVVNSPSGGSQRAVVNALSVMSVAPVGPPVQLAIEPREFSVLSGERMPLQLTGLDQYYNPVTVSAQAAQWEAAPMLGEISKGGVFTGATAKAPIIGLVMARMGTMLASSVVHVTPGPARVVVTPARVTLQPGATQQFVAQAYDEDDQPVTVSPGRMVWRAETTEAGAKISPTGQFQAPTQNGHVAVLACVGSVCGEADVIVGEEFGVVESFEEPGNWTYRAEPPSTSVGVDWGTDPLRPRNHALRLRYDFSKGAGTRAAYVDLNVQLPETTAFSVYVLGDGQGAWLRARLRDGAGREFSVNLAERVSWSGSWRRLTGLLPDDVVSPVTLESIYVAEIHDEHRLAGAIWLDDIAAGEATAAGAGGAALGMAPRLPSGQAGKATQ